MAKRATAWTGATEYRLTLTEADVIALACGRVRPSVKRTARRMLDWIVQPNPAQRLKKRGWTE